MISSVRVPRKSYTIIKHWNHDTRYNRLIASSTHTRTYTHTHTYQFQGSQKFLTIVLMCFLFCDEFKARKRSPLSLHHQFHRTRRTKYYTIRVTLVFLMLSLQALSSRNGSCQLSNTSRLTIRSFSQYNEKLTFYLWEEPRIFDLS